MGALAAKRFAGKSWKQKESTNLCNMVSSMATDNVMARWIKEETRFRCVDTPARLDLLTKESDVIESMQCLCPLGKGDHEVTEFQTTEDSRTSKDKSSRCGRYTFL